MARFNLFSYIKWKNDKHELLSNSSYKQFFDENFHVLEHYPWLNKYMSYESSFDLIKSTIIIKTILNKKQKSLNAMVLQEKAIDKWDGKLPQYYSGKELPFIMQNK